MTATAPTSWPLRFVPAWGTGVSVHELHIFELQGGGFSRPASLTEEELRSLVTDYVDSESLVEDGRTLMTLYWSGTSGCAT